MNQPEAYIKIDNGNGSDSYLIIDDVFHVNMPALKKKVYNRLRNRKSPSTTEDDGYKSGSRASGSGKLRI